MGAPQAARCSQHTWYMVKSNMGRGIRSATVVSTCWDEQFQQTVLPSFDDSYFQLHSTIRVKK
eukprot:3206874-Rhodomonas_salina.1